MYDVVGLPKYVK